MKYANGEEYDGFWANGRQATEEEAAQAEAEDASDSAGSENSSN